MKFICLMAVAATLASAQTSGNAFSQDAQKTWALVKGNVLKAAEKMPEENYSFKPTPDVRNYGALVAHVADANLMICGAAKGEKKPASAEKTKTAKADIIGALKESIAYCDSAFEGLTDEAGAKAVNFFGGSRPMLGVLQFNSAHDFEHYGNMVTYLRLKGIVPPSSEGR